MKKAVLYVDDNVHNLNSFRATFRRDYDVHIAESAKEGFDILEKIPIKIIVADYKMPVMTGVDFFAEVLKLYPDTVRILLTGYADITAVIGAINQGQVYRFITKPWDEQELRVSLENAFEIYETRVKLEQKNEELQKSYDELDKFVYSAAHDLTAPLSSIQGIINIARMDKEDTDKYLDMIEKSIKKLNIFIQNIIDYHRNNKQLTSEEQVNIGELIQDTFEGFNYYPGRKKVQFLVENEVNEPLNVDVARLQIVLNNLISNALKYQRTDEENPFIKVSTFIENDFLKIKIADNGIGIKEDHLENIFKMFFRASHQNAGTGIGLYIVNEVVSKLEGKIEVESTPGQGSVFTLSIPCKPNIPNPSSENY